MLASRTQTPTLTITKETETSPEDDDVTPCDVTQRSRSPVEDAFYESFLLRSHSNVESLYASNVYCSQKHAKEAKDLERQKMASMTAMSKEQKEMLKKMNKLQQKMGQIQEAKDQKSGTARADAQITCNLRPITKKRFRSGSMPFLDPKDLQALNAGSRDLSKSSENLREGSPNQLLASSSKQIFSKSCGDVLGLGGTPKGKVALPPIARTSSCEAIDNGSEEESVFITKQRVPAAPPSSPKVKQRNLLKPVGFDAERRRGSLPNPVELDRQIASERRRGSMEVGTRTKWVPKTLGPRSLPPL